MKLEDTTTIDDLLEAQLRAIDEARAIPRPHGIRRFYLEEAVDKKAAEQPLLWAARGEAGARVWEAKSAASAYRAGVVAVNVAAQQEVVANARERFELTAGTLAPYTRRAAGEKVLYYLRWLLILGGDVAGVAGAAILLGETVGLGVLQAVASGTAAITSGLLAQEVRDSRLARKREKLPRDLTGDERRFAHLFRGGDSGERIVKPVVTAGALIGALIAGSIFALRFSTEGSTAAWAFGLLAAAIALASWANVYHYTDEASDLIDARRADYRRELKRLERLLRANDISEHDEAVAHAVSIRAESASRGHAAQRAVEATGGQLLNEHADVAGHGWRDEVARDAQHSDSHHHEERGVERHSPPQLPRIDLTVAYERVARGSSVSDDEVESLLGDADHDARGPRQREVIGLDAVAENGSSGFHA
jgi:hypothetical protein